MSNLTKEQLKNVLINHGVSTPPSSAKKEEYIKLYDEYVAPVVSNKGEFSSDDEPDTSNVADSGLIRNIIQKEEYIKLYDEYVAPVISNKGEFSSDDEPDTSNVADSGLIRNIIQ
ncbi:hypothetical protein QYM36_005507, partial [Artemia franciscana]